MEIQPIVIGTAGHIDHGKSTLVRALTGVDPDRLKEEKERGLTIDLGFAPLELPDGRLVGIVDVPGHERFIRNMVAGATGIDLVLLVVAADDGVMPQTREHLQIMQLLGVERGMVALTKVDMVEPDLVDLSQEDVAENVAGTFLEGAPVCRVSAITGEGLEELREVLFGLAAVERARDTEGIFRMPIQRVFTKRGFGTVLTGIPVSGRARVGDVLEVLPGGARGKVRGLNAYRETATVVQAGHSSAINLSDVDHKDLERGHVVATPGFFTPRRMLAARLEVLADVDRSLTNRLPVRLHTGTADVPGELVLLDQEELAPGASGLVQLRLAEPIVAAPGDRFVLRLLSPVVTLGGGVILEESRYRLKRFKGFVLEGLASAERSLASPKDLLEAGLARADRELVATEDLAVLVKRPREETRALLEELHAEGRLLAPKPERWMHVDRMADLAREVRGAVEAWFADEPHRTFMDVRELRIRTQLDPALLAVVLEHLVGAGHLETPGGGRVRPVGREGELGDGDRDLAERVRGRLAEAGFQPPSPADLGRELGAEAARLGRVLEHLADLDRVARIGPELFLASDRRDRAREAIVENCTRHGQLEIPELRDRLDTSRKFLIPLLEYFDAQGLTIRQGGHRVLKR